MADKTIGELPSVASVTDDTLIPVEQNTHARKMTGAQFREWAEAGAAPYVTQAQAAAEAAADSALTAQVNALEAGDSEDNAEQYKDSALGSAQTAAAERAKIENLGVAANTLAAGSNATVNKTESGGEVTLTFGIPRGNKGDAASVSIGTVSALSPGSTPTVTNSGTSSAAVLNFGIPRGEKGDKGDPGGVAEVTLTSGYIFFNIGPGEDEQGNPEDGHLLLTYAGDDAAYAENYWIDFISEDVPGTTYGHLMLTVNEEG